MPIKTVQFHNRNHNTVATLKAASGTGNSTVTSPDKTATLITRATVHTMVEDAAKKATSFIMINKPTIISPENETYDYFGDITASTYSTVGTFVGTHTSTDWQFSKTPDFVSP